MATKWAYRDGRSFGVPAQTAGDRLEEIRRRNGGQITPAAIVEDAADPVSPIHPVFDWDDASAARAQREHRARQLLSGIVEVRVEIVDDRPKEARQIAYVSVGTRKEGACYLYAPEAMAEPDSRDRVLADARRSLRAWRSRFDHLADLADVVAEELGDIVARINVQADEPVVMA